MLKYVLTVIYLLWCSYFISKEYIKKVGYTMSLFELNDDNMKVDLSSYNNEENEVIVINESVKDISFTSYNKICNVSIIVKDRESDLVIRIKDIMINSRDDICFDLRGSVGKNYKINVNFSGYNEIYTNDNICIAVGNNHDIIFEGLNGGVLKCERKISGPSFGSGIYTMGSANAIFIGSGTVEFLCNNEGDAVSFINKDFSKSSIKVYDDIKFIARGGDGRDIDSIKTDISAGNGGSGIYIEGEGSILNFSNKTMKVSGGNGGCNTEQFGGGVCGDGGNAIKLGAGYIVLKNNSILEGGDGGQIKEKTKHYMSRGGNGGACIEVVGFNNIDTDIRISSGVKAYGGNGGCSHLHIDDKGDFMPVSGGNGGGLISNTSNNNISFYRGDIEFVEGLGGICVYDENIKKGDDGDLTQGGDITILKINETDIIENTMCDNCKYKREMFNQGREIQKYQDKKSFIERIKACINKMLSN